MVYNGKSQSKIDDFLGVPLFMETPKYIYHAWLVEFNPMQRPILEPRGTEEHTAQSHTSLTEAGRSQNYKKWLMVVNSG